MKLKKLWRGLWYEKISTTKVICSPQDVKSGDKWFTKSWKWYHKDLRDFIDIFIENPLKEWKKTNRLFVKPKASFYFFNSINSNCPYAYIPNVPSVLCIRSLSVGWKDKYGEPRHEQDPYIWVCFFRKFGFSINWYIPGISYNDSIYWEYLLDYLYYRKDITVWDKWTSNGEVIDTPEFSLSEKGKTEYNKKIIEKEYMKILNS